ncbi:hypothetical protein [Paenibacillus sp. 1P07SE]|uniref:hypothetical protein n=1 Tax=Paenibacillus sp. 1P07SE TaxID=3132209 RepID=UPI0039A5F3D9
MRAINLWIQSHLAALLLLVVLAGAAALIVPLQADLYRPTATVQHLSGDPAALQGLTVTGTFNDFYHKSDFRIAGEHSVSEAEIFPVLRPLPPSQQNQAFSHMIGETRIEVANYAHEHIIRRYEQSINGGMTIAVVRPVLRPDSSENSSDPNYFTLWNSVEYGLTNIGDTVYYIAPSSPQHTGTNAIFEVAFQPRMVEGEEEVSRRVVEFSLQGNSNADAGPTLGILGLEAVGGQLLLLAAEDGMLTVTRYNPENGERTGHVTLPQISLTASDGRVRYELAYNAFPDEGEGLLHLRLPSSQSSETRIVETIVTLESAEELAIKSVTPASYERVERNGNGAILHMSWHYGRLYVIRMMAAEDFQAGIISRLGGPQRIRIEAYEEGELIYTGELAADAKDDSIRSVYQMPSRAAVGDLSANRMLARIAIAKTRGEDAP